MWVVDKMLWAVHDSEFAEAVADDELVDADWVGDDITWLRILAQVNWLSRRRWHHHHRLSGWRTSDVVGLL